MMRKLTVACMNCNAKATNIFCKLDRELTELLSQKKNSHYYNRKQDIYCEGSAFAGIFCVRSGRIKVYKTGPEGKQYIVRLAEPGDVLGLESLFGLEENYLSTAEMMEEGIVCFIDKNTVMDLVRRHPPTARNVMDLLSSQLRISEEERLELAQMAVRERMARLLALLSKTHGVAENNGGVRINLHLTREEMAEMIGTASETAMRLLSEFKEERVIDLRGKDITILNRDHLLQRANLME